MTRHTGRKPGFGAVEKLSNGRFRARYYGPDGRRHTAPVTFMIKADARAWLATQQADIVRQVWEPQAKPKVTKTTFAGYADQWLAHRQLKDRTREHYRKILDHHLFPAFGSWPLSAITADDVRAWHTKFGTGSPTMRSHAYGLLRTILHTAVSDGRIAGNPCVIRGASSTKRVHQIRPATRAEVEKITQNMPEPYQAMILLAARCALRFGELTELRRKDVVIDADGYHGVIRVQRAVVRAGDGFTVTTPKSDAGTRDVAIPPHLLVILLHHLTKHVGIQPDSLLFPAAHGGHLAPGSLYRQFYKARAAADRPDLRFHDLRHTGAVFAAQTGATLAELMARLGHSTPQAAMRYQHAAAGRDRAIAAALSRIALDG